MYPTTQTYTHSSIRTRFKNVYRKSFIQLSDSEKDKTVFTIMSKHFKMHNSIARTTELWKNIYDLLRDQIFTVRDNVWFPNNLNEILNF
jgi:hypothetical protein